MISRGSVALSPTSFKSWEEVWSEPLPDAMRGADGYNSDSLSVFRFVIFRFSRWRPAPGARYPLRVTPQAFTIRATSSRWVSTISTHFPVMEQFGVYKLDIIRAITLLRTRTTS